MQALLCDMLTIQCYKRKHTEELSWLCYVTYKPLSGSKRKTYGKTVHALLCPFSATRKKHIEELSRLLCEIEVIGCYKRKTYAKHVQTYLKALSCDMQPFLYSVSVILYFLLVISYNG